MSKEQNVEHADVIAIFEAHLRGDEGAINVIFDSVDAYALCAAIAGFAVQAIGEARLREILAEWRQAD